VLPNLSLVLELLGNVFTNFIFEKFLSHEALVTERVTGTSNNQTQLLSSYKWQKLFERCNLRSFDSFRSKFFAKVISRFKSFSLIEYDLWIFPSVFLMEMIDLRGRELKYAKELLLNHYRKSSQNSMRLQDMWVELKLWSRTTYVRCFDAVYTRQTNAIPQPG